jgi:hypothetical protein
MKVGLGLVGVVYVPEPEVNFCTVGTLQIVVLPCINDHVGLAEDPPDVRTLEVEESGEIAAGALEVPAPTRTPY